MQSSGQLIKKEGKEDTKVREIQGGSLTYLSFIHNSSSRTIEHLLKKWSLQCVHIPLDFFCANHGNVGGSSLSDGHTLQMMEITKLHCSK